MTAFICRIVSSVRYRYKILALGLAYGCAGDADLLSNLQVIWINARVGGNQRGHRGVKPFSQGKEGVTCSDGIESSSRAGCRRRWGCYRDTDLLSNP